MKAYEYSYKAIAWVITLFGTLLFLVGLANGNILQAIGSVFVCALIWYRAFKAGKDNKKDIVISSAIPALISLLIVYRLFQRAIFVIENGGMESAIGFGSPLAFLVGLSFELVLFIPLLCLFLVGLFSIVRCSKPYA